MNNLRCIYIHFWKWCKKIPNKIFIFIIKVYRVIFSPSVGILRYFPLYPAPSCIFFPTCSQYSVDCFKRYSFFTALKKTLRRISRCHPGTQPQIDLP